MGSSLGGHDMHRNGQSLIGFSHHCTTVTTCIDLSKILGGQTKILWGAKGGKK